MNSKWEIKFGCTSTRKDYKVKVEKLKPIKYGPFKILENIGNNIFQLHFPPYMQIYSIANVENLRLQETHMIVDQEENVKIPSI